MTSPQTDADRRRIHGPIQSADQPRYCRFALALSALMVALTAGTIAYCYSITEPSPAASSTDHSPVEAISLTSADEAGAGNGDVR